MLSDFNILSQTNLVWSIFFLLDTVIASELFDRVEHKGAGKNENRTCKQLDVKADPKYTVVDIFAHISKPDSIEPGAGASVKNDLHANEESGDEEHPGSGITTLTSWFPIFHDENDDGDEGNGDGEHGRQLNNEKPYWSFHELAGVVKSAVNEPGWIPAIRKKAIVTEFVS